MGCRGACPPPDKYRGRDPPRSGGRGRSGAKRNGVPPASHTPPYKKRGQLTFESTSFSYPAARCSTGVLTAPRRAATPIREFASLTPPSWRLWRRRSPRFRAAGGTSPGELRHRGPFRRGSFHSRIQRLIASPGLLPVRAPFSHLRPCQGRNLLLRVMPASGRRSARLDRHLCRIYRPGRKAEC